MFDSGFQAVDFGFQVLDSRLPGKPEQLGFRIPIHSGFRIPWALFRIPKPRIPDSTKNKFSGFRFHKHNFSGFQKPDSLIWSDVFSGHRIKPTSSIKRTVLTNPPPPSLSPLFTATKTFFFFWGTYLYLLNSRGRPKKWLIWAFL